MSIPELYKPSDLAKRLGTSDRRVRERARALGACLILGKNRIALTESDVIIIMESFRCRSKSTRGAKSTTTAARLPDVSYEDLREQLRKKERKELRPRSKIRVAEVQTADKA